MGVVVEGVSDGCEGKWTFVRHRWIVKKKTADAKALAGFFILDEEHPGIKFPLSRLDAISKTDEKQEFDRKCEEDWEVNRNLLESFIDDDCLDSGWIRSKVVLDRIANRDVSTAEVTHTLAVAIENKERRDIQIWINSQNTVPVQEDEKHIVVDSGRLHEMGVSGCIGRTKDDKVVMMVDGAVPSTFELAISGRKAEDGSCKPTSTLVWDTQIRKTFLACLSRIGKTRDMYQFGVEQTAEQLQMQEKADDLYLRKIQDILKIKSIEGTDFFSALICVLDCLDITDSNFECIVGILLDAAGKPDSKGGSIVNRRKKKR